MERSIEPLRQQPHSNLNISTFH